MSDMNVEFKETHPVAVSVYSVNGKTGNVTITLKGLGGKNEKEILALIADAIKDKLDDKDAVHKTGDEHINGKKDFGDDVTVSGTFNVDKGIHVNGKYLYAKDDDFDIIGAKNGSIFLRRDQVEVREMHGNKVLVLEEDDF